MRSVTAILGLSVMAALAAPTPMANAPTMTELDAALKALEVNAPADADAIAHGGHLGTKRQQYDLLAALAKRQSPEEIQAALDALRANDPAEAEAAQSGVAAMNAAAPSLGRRQSPEEIQAALDALRANDPAEANAAQSGIADMNPAATTPAPATAVEARSDEYAAAVQGLMETDPEDAHELLNVGDIKAQADGPPDQPPAPTDDDGDWADKPAPPPEV